jgi:hypothetical protein
MDRPISYDDHVSTAAAIAPVRAPAGHELLAVEADEAVPTIAATDMDLSAINQGSVNLVEL